MKSRIASISPASKRAPARVGPPSTSRSWISRRPSSSSAASSRARGVRPGATITSAPARSSASRWAEARLGRADHDQRRLVDRADQGGVEGQPRVGVEDDPGGLSRGPVEPGGEQRVVGERGADADRDGVALGAPAVDQLAALDARDPAGVAGGRGDAAVERHRRLVGHQRAAGASALAEGLVEQASRGGLGTAGQLDRHPAVAEHAGPAAGGLLGRVLGRVDDAGDAGLEDRLGAGRLAAGVGAGLERDVDGRSGRVLARGRGRPRSPPARRGGRRARRGSPRRWSGRRGRAPRPPAGWG